MGSDSYWFLSFINGFLYHRPYSHHWKPGRIGKLEEKPQLNSLALTLTVVSNHRLVLLLELTNGSPPAAQLSSHEDIQASSRPKGNRSKPTAWCGLTNCPSPGSLLLLNSRWHKWIRNICTSCYTCRGLNSAGQGCQGHQLALKGHTAPLSHTLPCLLRQCWCEDEF